MRNGAWFCAVCKRSVPDPWERLEKRIEYRRTTNQARYRVRLLAHVCTSCVDAEEQQDTDVQTVPLFEGSA